MAFEAAITLDASGFESGVNKAKEATNGLLLSLSSLGGGLGGQALAAFGAAASVAGIAMKGMWDAMGKGKELQIIAEQSGVTVRELSVLDKAFSRVGMSAEDLPRLMTHFNESLAKSADPSSKVAQALGKIGISAQALQGKTLFEQFRMVANGMDGVASSGMKMAIAAELFGARKGALLLPVLKGASMEKAEKGVLGSAQIYEDYAPTFAAFQTGIKKLAVSWEPLFAGMASKVIPVLMDVVDKLERIDLTEVGVSLGNGIAIAVEMLKDAAEYVKSILPKPSKGTQVYAGMAFQGMGGFGMTGGGKGMAEAAAEQEKATEETKSQKGIFDTILEKYQKRVDEAQVKTKAERPAFNPGINQPLAPAMATPIGALIGAMGKIGGGGSSWQATPGGDEVVNLNRQQLDQQRRTADATEKLMSIFMGNQYKQFGPSSTEPQLGY